MHIRVKSLIMFLMMSARAQGMDINREQLLAERRSALQYLEDIKIRLSLNSYGGTQPEQGDIIPTHATLLIPQGAPDRKCSCFYGVNAICNCLCCLCDTCE